ncbi:hypothetical protein EIK77_001961, partial [Talaromyces pinophilus]
MTRSPVYVAGVGMTPFQSPKKSAASAANPAGDYFDLAVSACVKALLDAGLTYDDVDQGVGCYVFGDSACAQRVFYTLGMTGIPIYNVHNYCSSGSSGLYMANQFIQAGTADCVLVVGFDKMYPGALPQIYKDRENPLGRILNLSKQFIPEGQAQSAGWTPQLYANAQTEYLEKYGPQGAKKEHFSAITSINRTHGMNNPYSQLRQAVSAAEVASSPTTGAAAAVVVSERFLQSHPYLKDSAIVVKGQAMATDSPKLYEPPSAIELIGSDMTRRAARNAYREAGLTSSDVQVVELHDCFTTNEMCALEDLGLAAQGEGWKLVAEGAITYLPDSESKRTSPGWIVNPSGGLISKGHPLGATGLAQITELVWHLRGWAENRTVPGTKYCLQHNMGLGGATVVSILGRADGQTAPRTCDKSDGRQRLGYNPALEARGIREEDFDAVHKLLRTSVEWVGPPQDREPDALPVKDARLRQSDRNSRERPPSDAPVSFLGPAIDYLDAPLVGHDIDSHSSSENNTLFFDFSAFSRNALDLWCSSSTALPEPPYGDVFPLEDPEGLDLNLCEGVLPSALSPQNIHQTTIAPQLPNPEQDSRRNGNQAEEGINPVASKDNHLLREVVPNFRRIATGMFYAPDVSNNGSDESIRRRGEALGVYFQESVFVPSVTNIDIPSWRSLCRRILHRAQSSSIVSNAVVALAQLHFVKFPPSAERGKEPQVLRNGYNLAQYLYIFAKETLGNGLDFLQKEPSESLRLELLVALFLLSCFELIDKEDIHRAHQLKWADNLLEGIEQSDFMVQQIIHLMLLCDARVVTLGGNGILPRKPPPLPSGPYTPVSPATNYNQATESSRQDTGEVHRQNEIRPRSPPPDRLAKRPRQLERSGQEYSPLSLSTLKESILRDAVYFHHRSEQFLRRVAMLDRHRRPRGTPEDEVEVTASARSIINDLHRLWDERPAILDSDRQELSQVLHPELARDVARLLCVFRA